MLCRSIYIIIVYGLPECPGSALTLAASSLWTRTAGCRSGRCGRDAGHRATQLGVALQAGGDRASGQVTVVQVLFAWAETGRVSARILPLILKSLHFENL